MEPIARWMDQGRPSDLLDALRGLDDRQRRAAATWALTQWKNQPKPRHLPHWRRWQIVLAATAADAKKSLAIPVRHASWDALVRWAPDEWLSPAPAEDVAALAEALIGRGPEFGAAWLALVLEAKKPQPMWVEVPLLLAQAHGLPLPATDVLARSWAAAFSMLVPREPGRDDPPYERTVRRFALAQEAGRWTVRGQDLSVATPVDALRGTLQLQPMLLSLFDHPDAVGGLVGRYSSQFGMDAVATMVAALVADGTLDGAALARQAIAALARGDAVATQRLQARLLEVAQPGPALVREQARVLVSLLASGNATPAALAQGLLQAADAQALLPDDLFAEACQVVFARKEKGLRSAQVAWARARAARPGGLASAAAGLAQALAVPDHPLQREAAAALEALKPALGVDAAAVLAVADEPPAPAPRPAPPRPGLRRQRFEPVPDPTMLPPDVEVALQTYHGQRDPVAHERAVVAAMDLLAGGQAGGAQRLLQRLGSPPPFGTSILRDATGPEMHFVGQARLDELMALAQAGRPVAFLSRPTWAHGAIDAADLAERLERQAAQGAEAPKVDLLLALLRTGPCDAAVLARLRAIGSAQAGIAADFLAAGGSGQIATEWQLVDRDPATPPYAGRFASAWLRQGAREVFVRRLPVPQPPRLDGVPLGWARGFDAATAPEASEFDAAPPWLGPLLPHHAEALAAQQLWGFRRAGMEYGSEGGKNVVLRLPDILSAHGPAGPALHLAVLYAMSANDAPARLAGSDGMVELLQQGRWQADLASTLVAECLRCGSLKPGRLAGALAQVHEAGEAAAVWALLQPAAAAALALDAVPTATADLLALGAEIAPGLPGARGFAELDAAVAAVRGKPGKLQQQAQRLHAVLAGRGA